MASVPDLASPDVRALLDRVAALTSVAQAVGAERSRDFSPDANVFDLLGSSEAALSAFFAWLLDPTQTHGQEDAFLQKFITRYLPPDIADAVAGHAPRVDLEAGTRDGGFIDILLTWPGRATVGIENKPTAAFQPGQVGRYIRDLARRESPLHHMVVLVGWSGDASKHLLDHLKSNGDLDLQDRCAAFDYANVAGWITASRAKARSTRVTDLLAQCEKHLGRYQGGGMGSTDDLVVAEALSTVDRLKAASGIMASSAAIKRRVASDALDRVRRDLAMFNPEESGFASGGNRTWLSFDVGAAPFKLMIWFDAGDFRQLSFGLWNAARSNDARGVSPTDLSRVLEEHYGPSKYRKYGWAYWRRPDPNRSPFSCADVDDVRDLLPWLGSDAFTDDLRALAEKLSTWQAGSPP